MSLSALFNRLANTGRWFKTDCAGGVYESTAHVNFSWTKASGTASQAWRRCVSENSKIRSQDAGSGRFASTRSVYDGSWCHDLEAEARCRRRRRSARPGDGERAEQSMDSRADRGGHSFARGGARADYHRVAARRVSLRNRSRAVR
jgi:hypothetical protein